MNWIAISVNVDSVVIDYVVFHTIVVCVDNVGVLAVYATDVSISGCIFCAVVRDGTNVPPSFVISGASTCLPRFTC